MLYIKKDTPLTFYLLSGVWLVINIVQSYFTEIHPDEAYYFLYGQHPAWGYFDHPPMVGIMTYIGGKLFAGNLGVRIMGCIAQWVTLIVLYDIACKRNRATSTGRWLLIMLAAQPMFNAYGFITVPDSFLLLFSALFLAVYQRFLQRESLANTLLLSLTMAAMCYSKYHALLFIALVVLSNPRLLLRPKSWIALAGTALLLLPHLWWQIREDFPSVKYHLVERSSSFSWQHLWEYLPNQLAVFSPFVLIAVVWVLIRCRTVDPFERALRFIIVGFLLFFQLMGFKGYIQPHWTVVASLPMALLVAYHAPRLIGLQRYINRVVLPSIVLILLVRVALTTTLPPQRMWLHSKAVMSQALAAKVGDVPVLFAGSFQDPSLYGFFTGKESLLVSSIDTRRTQFDVWQSDTLFHNRRVFVCTVLDLDKQGNAMVEGYIIDSLQTVNRLKVTYSPLPKELSVGDTLRVDYTVTNPHSYPIDMNHRSLPVDLQAVYINAAGDHFLPTDQPRIEIPPHTTLHGSFTTVVPDLAGEIQWGLTLSNPLVRPANSPFTPIRITHHAN